MSSCRKEGKDTIIFATADDHKEPSSVKLPELEPEEGVILPNGEINWHCPCLGGMASGPCGFEFKEAFSCFYKSEAEPKGSDCRDLLQEMRLCMAEYPQLYYKNDDDDDDDDDIGMKLSDAEKALISEDSVKDGPKVGSFPKVEDKPTEKIKSIHSEPKSSSKSPAPATGSLKING